MKITLHRSTDQQSPVRKLALKKETLRQLTGFELRQIAGGAASSGTSVISVSGTSVISSGTSVISSGTSVINPSGGVPSGRH